MDCEEKGNLDWRERLASLHSKSSAKKASGIMSLGGVSHLYQSSKFQSWLSFALYFPKQCLQQFLLLAAALLMQGLADNSCYTCFQITPEMEPSNETPGL